MERIKSAAIKMCDGLIIEGINHSQCFRKSKEMGRKEPSAKQGFLTTEGRFINRKEALIIAGFANQIVYKHNPKDILLSEDLKF